MRYRTLDVRVWCDEKFRSLSPLKPSGQALFLYLLSNPHTTSIPGLYRAGAAAMAEELGWTHVGFFRALREIIGEGLVKMDLKARVVFIPNAIKYNKPQSPNVIRSWAVHWDEIPECPLKDEAYRSISVFIQHLGKAFRQAFEEALTVKSPIKVIPSESETLLNQEQNQEQKQEQDQNKNQPTISKRIERHSFAELSGFTYISIPLRHQHSYAVSKKECEAWQAVYKNINVFEELQLLAAWNQANPNKRKSHSDIRRHIHAWLTKEHRQKLKTSFAYKPAVSCDYNVHIAKNWLNETEESDNFSEFQFLGRKHHDWG